MTVSVVERDMTKAEYQRTIEGFHENGLEFGNPHVAQVRYGFVALDGERFVGCSSGLTNDNGRWFYLSELFVEKPYRHQGLGSVLLAALEKKVATVGVARIYTRTAGYEAPGFYKKQGYEVFCEMENWYRSGHGQVWLWKTLDAAGR